MSDVINLNLEKMKRDPETLRLKLFSDSIDDIVRNQMKNGSNPVAIAAILFNRFLAVCEVASKQKGFDVAEMIRKIMYKKDK